MANIDLHKFRDDLRKRSPKGSGQPPVGIRAQDLDDNFHAVALINGAGSPPLYEVEYTKDGTRIARILPDGARTGDLLVWDGSRWAVLAATQSSTLHILGIQNGALRWVETAECEQE